MKYGIQLSYYKEHYAGDPTAKDFFFISKIKLTNKGIVRDNYKNWYESKYMGRNEIYQIPRLGKSYHFHEFTAKEYVIEHPKASNLAQVNALKEINKIFTEYKSSGKI
jgi:hypothetical protein